MVVTIIATLVALVLGGALGFFIFRYVIKGKYNEMIAAANQGGGSSEGKETARSKGEVPQQESRAGERGAAAQLTHSAEREQAQAA